MSSIHVSAVLANPVGSALLVLDLCWLLPYRVLRACYYKVVPPPASVPVTSVWIAFASSLFAVALRHNWRLVLARPRWIDPKTGQLYPQRHGRGSSSPEGKSNFDHRDDPGFYGYLYTSRFSSAYGQSSVAGADAVWIWAHGGGFTVGEARQYHHTYQRWVDKAYREHGFDLRILAVEYRQYLPTFLSRRWCRG